MTDKQKKKCHGIIHGASAAAAGIGAGLAQLPGSDSVALVSIQTAMVIGLGKVFGVELTESAAKAAIATATATLVGRGVSQFLVGWIPSIGNAINATTAAGITEAVGWIIAGDIDKEQA
ncbi:MAG: hypothetical protein J5999_02450 [Oscillospiraceae bacterium]|nr:hypothetical protein [Oscillospiraceae bacterium]